MQPTQELIDDIYRRRVLQARAMSPEEKLLAGPRLFEAACAIALAGIREQFLNTTEAERTEILRKRLRWRRELEERLLFKSAEEST